MASDACQRLRPVDRLRGVKSSEVIVRALGGAPETIAALFDFAPPPERRKNLRLAQNGWDFVADRFYGTDHSAFTPRFRISGQLPHCYSTILSARVRSAGGIVRPRLRA